MQADLAVDVPVHCRAVGLGDLDVIVINICTHVAFFGGEFYGFTVNAAGNISPSN